MVHFLFRHHTNSVKLFISVFGHAWPGWKCSYNLKTFGQRFQVLCLSLAKLTEKLIIVCFPCKNSLDISLLVFQEHAVCE